MIGEQIHTFDDVESTNSIGKELAMKGKPEGTVIIARRQAAGRGRSGREWFSPDGGIWLSIILLPKLSVKDVPKVTLVTLISSIAVAKTLKALHNIDAVIKWPNDVLVNGKKVCGVLNAMASEGNVIDYVITGIGINTNIDVKTFPESIRPKAISTRQILGKDIDNDEMITALLKEFNTLYEKFKAMQHNDIVAEWRSLSDTIGRHVEIVTEEETLEGLVEDIDEDGALIMKIGDTTRKIFAGECVYLR